MGEFEKEAKRILRVHRGWTSDEYAARELQNAVDSLVATHNHDKSLYAIQVLEKIKAKLEPTSSFGLIVHLDAVIKAEKEKLHGQL